MNSRRLTHPPKLEGHYLAENIARRRQSGLSGWLFNNENPAHFNPAMHGLVLGQSRHSGGAPVSSGLPRKADVLSVRRHVSNVPKTEIRIVDVLCNSKTKILLLGYLHHYHHPA